MISFMERPTPDPGHKPCFYAHFDGMCWPLAGAALAELEWLFRYGEEEFLGPPTRNQLLVAASVLEAYRELVNCPRSKREAVIRRLRAAVREGDQP